MSDSMIAKVNPYNQVNGTDATTTSMIFPATLIGSLAVGAGKVVFGWVPRMELRIEYDQLNSGGRVSGQTIYDRPIPATNLVDGGKIWLYGYQMGWSCYGGTGGFHCRRGPYWEPHPPSVGGGGCGPLLQLKTP